MEIVRNQTEKFFNFPNPGLRSYFSRVEQGSPDDIRPPFWKGMDRSDVLAKWQKIVDKHTLHKDYPTLYDFEMEMKGKVGPMSIMLPLSKRIEDVNAYYNFLSDGEVISDSAIGKTIQEFSKSKGLRLRSQRNTVQSMRLSTSAGNPYFVKRRTVVNKTLPTEILYQDGEITQILANAAYKACAILGWRGQEGGPTVQDVKQRVIWMFPFAVNIAELQLYQPLIEAFQKFGYVPAWNSMDSVDTAVTNLFKTKGDKDLVMCTDFTKFDQSFNSVCQNAAKDILYGLMSPSAEREYWLNNVFEVKYNIPIALGLDTFYTGHHGMASGSGGTNVDETLVHRSLQHSAAISADRVLNAHSQCLGDDGMLSYPGLSPEQVMQEYESHGLKMNASKQYSSTHDCVYLRRWHSDSYTRNGTMVGVYPTFRALGRLLSQERYYDPDTWSSEMVVLRALSILENCKHHPLFEEFVDFCMSGDKLKLGTAVPGFFDKIDKLSKQAIDNMPDFMGYTKTMQSKGKSVESGISNWRVVQYLKSKL